MKLSKNKFILILILILIAAVFRFPNIGNVGIFTYDEGQLMAEGQFDNSVLVWSKNYLVQIIPSKQKADDTSSLVKQFKAEGMIPRTGRLFHSFLLSWGVFFDGIGVTPGLLMMSFFGVLCVVLTFYLALKLTNSTTIAFLSGLILAVVPYHILYSRTLISETDAQAFFLISLLFYLRFLQSKRDIFYFLSAFFIGMCFITNGDRITFFALPLLDLVIHRKYWWKSILIFSSGFAIPIILAETPYYLAFLLTHNLGIILNIPTYLEQQLWAHTRLSRFGFEISFFPLFTYPYLLILFGGFTFTLGLIAGFVEIIKNKFKRDYLIILFPVILTFLFQSIYSLKVSRALMQVLPLLSICAAIGLISISKRIGKVFIQQLVLKILILVFILESIFRVIPLLGYKNSLPQLIEYLNLEGSSKIVATNAPALRVYLSKNNIKGYQETLLKSKDIRDYYEYDYLVVTPQKYTFVSEGKYLTKSLDENLDKIEKTCTPVKIIPQNIPPILLNLFTFDHNANLEKTLTFTNNFDYQKDWQIKIYNPAKCLKLMN